MGAEDFPIRCGRSINWNHQGSARHCREHHPYESQGGYAPTHLFGEIKTRDVSLHHSDA